MLSVERDGEAAVDTDTKTTRDRRRRYVASDRHPSVQLTNARGRPVDPVPFLVVAALAFLVSFSYGPIYCLELGLSLPAGLGISTGAFSVATGIAYHRLVRRARPDLRGEVPAEYRLRRIVYAALVCVALLGLLALPLLVA